MRHESVMILREQIRRNVKFWTRIRFGSTSPSTRNFFKNLFLKIVLECRRDMSWPAGTSGKTITLQNESVRTSMNLKYAYDWIYSSPYK